MHEIQSHYVKFVWKSSGVQMEIEYFSMIKFVYKSLIDLLRTYLRRDESRRGTWKMIMINQTYFDWMVQINLFACPKRKKKTSIKFNFGVEAEWRTWKKKMIETQMTCVFRAHAKLALNDWLSGIWQWNWRGIFYLNGNETLKPIIANST